MEIKRFVAKGMRVLFKPAAVTNSIINKKSKICSGTQITTSTIDRYSYVGHDCFVLCSKIGPFCSIADNCRIGGINHPMNYVSTSPVFNKGKNILKKNFAQFEQCAEIATIINADVWIGANAIIKSGVNIGIGAVIGAGSVVTHDVGNYEIWAGNPAKLIRKRFDDEMINKLVETKWWNWNEKLLKEYSAYFNDPKVFIDKCEDLK